MKKSTFHHAGLNSSRIQAVWRALRNAKRRGLTTLRLGQICGSTRPSSDISEARASGIPIAPAQYLGMSEKGKKIYRYFLA